ncbi:carboxypeptidase-like regulatory domain-containing protein [Actinoplanes sp. NPDC024001]|uniref:carboxypeptidase-like regulatory domain-containing protein n=1 Tax=Actinoplanes sp. NPDC024001 TaxID=3154598 RepID=UPI0033CA4FAF
MIHRFPLRASAVLAVAALAAGGIAGPAQGGTAAPGGRVFTTVVDRATGQPVEGACVILKVPGTGGLPDSCGADYSDQQGRIITDEVPAGTYQMFVVAPDGYGHQWAGPTGGTGDQREAAKIRVRPGQVSQASTVQLDSPGAISGVVRDPDGAPAPNAIVAITAWHSGVGPGLGAVRADEEGRYLIGQLGPYSWPLMFVEYSFPRQWSGGVGNRFRAETIGVRAGEETTYDMDLVAGSVLRGAVTVQDGSVADSWRLTAVNVTTGDDMGVADSTDAGDTAYEMPMAGPQQVTIEWDVRIGEEDRSGVEDTVVRVPASGIRTFNVTM